LKYTPDRQCVLSGLKRISRPGRRVYAGKYEVRKVLGGIGVSILTTPRGLMTGRSARRAGVGGEVLCEIW
jgi:small subunit ribosomal protein S8